MNIHFHPSIWAVLTGLSLTACYKDIDLEKYRPEPTLVLNSILSPDEVVRVQVARTVFLPTIGKRTPMWRMRKSECA